MAEKKQNWHKRSDPPKKPGQYFCRYVYEYQPNYPFYMVLRWNDVCEVPHFDNEHPGVMRVTHWTEIDEPED